MLDNLKLMLGINDTDKDELLELIISSTTKRLKTIIGTEVPSELNHIVLEVAIIRFNRIGSEGLASHSVEGESMSFSANDFDAFSDEIQAWLETQETSERGKVRFL